MWRNVKTIMLVPSHYGANFSQVDEQIAVSRGCVHDASAKFEEGKEFETAAAERAKEAQLSEATRKKLQRRALLITTEVKGEFAKAVAQLRHAAHHYKHARAEIEVFFRSPLSLSNKLVVSRSFPWPNYPKAFLNAFFPPPKLVHTMSWMTQMVSHSALFASGIARCSNFRDRRAGQKLSQQQLMRPEPSLQGTSAPKRRRRLGPRRLRWS